MTPACVGLGSNLGDSLNLLVQAKNRLAQHPAIEITRCSSVYRSEPVDAAGPDFLNAVLLLSTSLSAHQLLDVLQSIEAEFGRERPYRNAPRTLDLDLLLFGNEQINDQRLTVPHPRINERAFVLCPLAEVAPELSIDTGPLASQRLQRVYDASIFAGRCAS